MIFHNSFQCFLLPEVVSYDNAFLIFLRSFFLRSWRVANTKEAKRRSFSRKKEMFMGWRLLEDKKMRESGANFTSRKFLRNVLFLHFHSPSQRATIID